MNELTIEEYLNMDKNELKETFSESFEKVKNEIKNRIGKDVDMDITFAVQEICGKFEVDTSDYNLNRKWQCFKALNEAEENMKHLVDTGEIPKAELKDNGKVIRQNMSDGIVMEYQTEKGLTDTGYREHLTEDEKNLPQDKIVEFKEYKHIKRIHEKKVRNMVSNVDGKQITKEETDTIQWMEEYMDEYELKQGEVIMSYSVFSDDYTVLKLDCDATAYSWEFHHGQFTNNSCIYIHTNDDQWYLISDEPYFVGDFNTDNAGDKFNEKHMSEFGTMYEREEDTLYEITAVVEQYKPDYVLKHN